jgi:hypothetical protein
VSSLSSFGQVNRDSLFGVHDIFLSAARYGIRAA